MIRKPQRDGNGLVLRIAICSGVACFFRWRGLRKIMPKEGACMAVRDIVQLGDPRLRQTAAVVKDPTLPSLASLVEDLRDTLAHSRLTTGYGRGIAAPQLGVAKRVIFVQLPGK